VGEPSSNRRLYLERKFILFLPITKRIDLNLGYSCNARCKFCYYVTDVTSRNRDKDLSTEEARHVLKRHRRRGMEVVDLTGGEPTIRKDIVELVRYAKRELGYRHVGLITNGIRLRNREFAAHLVEAGADDFLFSLHGSLPGMHDEMTGVPGSFDKLIRGVQNVKDLSARVRANTVVTGENFTDIHNIAKIYSEMGVETVNFILFNPIEQAMDADLSNQVRYGDAAVELERVIEDFGGSFNKLTIRYMPFCVMPGRTSHIHNVHQVHFDTDEWNYYYRSRVRENVLKWLCGLAVGFALLPDKPFWLKRGFWFAKHAAILEAHSFLHKVRTDKCKRCAYRFVCGGVWKEYYRRIGDSELTPFEGEILVDPRVTLPDDLQERAAY
jgi:MoaA/NifB/PqqE/SkfB family radical SAM enzyme